VLVPRVVGLARPRAQSVLRKKGFRVAIKRIPNNAVPGTVVWTKPEPRARAPKGALVTLGVAVQDTTPKVACPSKALLGVYHPARLHVLATCRWFVGTVVAVRGEDDGDHHLDLIPDPGKGSFLNQGDRDHQHAGLLIELMPGQHYALPLVGEHLSVFGTWVYDADHGWNEIHPVWAIKYLDLRSLVRSLPPAVPIYDPTAPKPAPPPPSSSNCDPNYAGQCLDPNASDYDCAGGSGNGPEYVYGTVKVVGVDHFGLDGDHDGTGCE